VLATETRRVHAIAQDGIKRITVHASYDKPWHALRKRDSLDALVGVSSKKIPVFGDVVGQNARRSRTGRCPWDDDWPCC
jgi:hypothetical protein